MAEQNNQILLETKDLQKHFPIKDFFGRKKQAVKAVDGITFQIRKGETFGLVGESGCGKSTLGRTLIRMYEPTGGQIIFDGEDITKLEGAKLQPYHKRMQIIFQDPYSALDPHHNVEEIIREPMSLYTNASKSDIDEQIVELLKKVGMKADDMYKYAYEFSGGQRQRIGIARALAVKPEFLLCDEPISALDVSIQAQVVNMLEDLQEELGLTYLFVAHDLSMVRHISTRIGVMYLGKIGRSQRVMSYMIIRCIRIQRRFCRPFLWRIRNLREAQSARSSKVICQARWMFRAVVVFIQDVRTPNRSAVRWNHRWSSGRRGILWPAISGSAAANLICI